MKKLTMLFLAIMAIANVWAQADELKDLIYTADNKVVEAKILEVSAQEIKYKDWNNQMGPTFVLTASEIKKVQFSNGTEKTYSQSAPATTPVSRTQTTETKSANTEKTKMDLGFQSNIDLGGNLAFLDKYAQGGVDLTLGVGVRMEKWLYIGAAAGVLGEWGYRNRLNEESQQVKAKLQSYIVPVFADARVYAPTGSGYYPFAEIGIGGFVGLYGSEKGDNYSNTDKPKGGFYLMTGVGLEFKYVTIGAGYKLLRNEDLGGGISSRNHGYIKLGISLGRPQKIR